MLLIKNYHESNNHLGTETIISSIRKRFWITNLRNAVKKTAYQCQTCCNKKAKVQIPIMVQLPCSRVEPSFRPFSKCGTDYFGPYEISVNRKLEKRYSVLFTCMNTRAVHLEVANDLSSSAFIQF